MDKVYRLLFITSALLILLACETTPFERKPKNRVARNGSKCGAFITTITDSMGTSRSANISFTKKEYNLVIPFAFPKTGTWAYNDKFTEITLDDFMTFKVTTRRDSLEVWEYRDKSTTSIWAITRLE